ncbi:hypothetical protein DFJ77DRAFT_510089 [Powellomyces hirtus]|nr:hypothetical protein DFJ77DRAFT_510089 [Powellomyces hirtus]
MQVSAHYEPYELLLETVTERVRDALVQTKKQPEPPPRNAAPMIPGARATLVDSDDELDEAESEDGFGWESTDCPSAPEEQLVSFRNLSSELIPLGDDSPEHQPTPPRTAPMSLRSTIAQLESEFRSELDKSTMLVDLQHRYMRRRIAAAGARDAPSATEDILSILMELVRGASPASPQEYKPASVAANAAELEEFETELLDRLRDHLERPDPFVTPGNLCASMVSEQSRDFGRFIPTRVPSFGINLGQKEE